MQNSVDTTKKIPLPRGYVSQIATELNMHRNTVRKHFKLGVPRVVRVVERYVKEFRDARKTRDQIIESEKSATAVPSSRGRGK